MGLFESVRLAVVIGICRESTTLSEAGRNFFGSTRQNRKVQNDADRLRKYLTRFSLDWQSCKKAKGHLNTFERQTSLAIRDLHR